MSTPAVQNQNPGNLKDPSTGNFQSFSDPVEGKAALYNDLTAKMTGQSKTGLNGDSSLLDFAKTYAPASDNNDPVQYAANIANKMGISPDTKIGTLSSRIDDFASAVASNEDPSVQYQQSDVPPSPERKTFAESINQVPQSTPNQNTGVLGTNPNDDLYGKVLNNSITKGIEGVGNLLTGGGAGQLGNEVGTSLATIGEKAKGILGGQDNSKYLPDVNVGNAFGGALKTGLGAASLEGASALPGLLKGTDVLASPAVETALKGLDTPLSQFATMAKGDQLELLTQGLKDAPAADKLVIQQAIDKITPDAIKEAGGKVAFKQAYPKLAKLLTVGKYAIGGTLLGGAINKGEKILGLLK